MDHSPRSEPLPTYLQWRHAELLAAAALSDLRQVADEALEDVGRVQVTVVVHEDVDHALSVWRGGGGGGGDVSDTAGR